ncbi:MAG: cysteine desulfurase [Kiritimatiellae bacterium]|nr:cysteine desulfurase [Verrucomicrobiota bacterium]MBU4290050.1 cysteine desulfurase [Verrucomicrobiota bacterium]MCG2679580.1 cysteine desulfurase [Kiritimatiellia bacterium]
MLEKRIYLDHNATTRLHPSVRDEMFLSMDVFGNPSSVHSYGQEARRLVDLARQRVAKLIGATPDEIIFTSGGTEACNLAIMGIADASDVRRRHIITTSVEHQAVLNTCRFLENRGFRITYLSVDSNGLLDPSDVEREINEDSSLITIMLANNEVGTIQPVAEIAAIAKSKGILVHTDAVQAVGKIPINVKNLGIDLLSISAHKVGGPKGIGALSMRCGVRLTPLLKGGHQEHGLRAGTENVPGIVGFGKACDLTMAHQDEWRETVRVLRDRFERDVLNQIPGTQINGHPTQRIPNTSNLSFPGVNGEYLTMNLDLAGVAVSTGAACSSTDNEPSHVLLAMGKNAEEARNSLRFSFGIDTTSEEMDRVVEHLRYIVGQLRRTGRSQEKP